MTQDKQQPLVTGQIRNYANKQWYPYSMRVLKSSDLPSVLALYDYVVETMESTDMLWRYPDATVAAFLGQDGIVVGVFAEHELIGLRVMYFHHPGDQTNPLLGNIKSDYGETAHLALCVIHPDFRGNSLQKHMGIQLMKVAQTVRPFNTLCSIVSPHNYPSISDKFFLNMVVVKLMPKFRGIWRYIFYRNMAETVTAVDERTAFAVSKDYPRQIELLDAGFYGVQLGIEQGEMGMIFKNYQRAARNQQRIIIKNKLTEIETLALAIEEFSQEHALPLRIVFDMNLVLEEVIANIISYGYQDEREHCIMVDVSWDNNIVTLMVTDDAKQFNPLSLEAPDLLGPLEEREVGGLGIYFIKQKMDEVEYKYEQGHNVLKMRKNYPTTNSL